MIDKLCSLTTYEQNWCYMQGTVQGVEAVEAVLRFNPDAPSPMIGMCQNQLTWKPLMKAVEMVLLEAI